MHTYLKVKLVSLAQESTYIRSQERKFHTTSRQRKRMHRTLQLGEIIGDASGNNIRSGELNDDRRTRLEKRLAKAQRQAENRKAQNTFWGLRAHRTEDLRKASRHTHLAYGFLRGHDYVAIEKSTKPIDWDSVEAMVRKYHGEPDVREVMQRFSQWVDAANDLRTTLRY